MTEQLALNKNKIKESALLLIASTNKEDVILGCLLAYNELGLEYCKKLFGYYTYSSYDRIHSGNSPDTWYYYDEIGIDAKTLMILSDCCIFISHCIAITEKEYRNQCLTLIDMTNGE